MIINKKMNLRERVEEIKAANEKKRLLEQRNREQLAAMINLESTDVQLTKSQLDLRTKTANRTPSKHNSHAAYAAPGPHGLKDNLQLFRSKPQAESNKTSREHSPKYNNEIPASTPMVQQRYVNQQRGSEVGVTLEEKEEMRRNKSIHQKKHVKVGKQPNPPADSACPLSGILADDIEDCEGHAEKTYEQGKLEEIYRISGILGQVCLSERDIKEVVNYIIDVCPSMKDNFNKNFLTHQKTREVIENIQIEIYQQGQKIYTKKEKCDFAYLMLYGTVGQYNDRPKDAAVDTPADRGSTGATEDNKTQLSKQQDKPHLTKRSSYVSNNPNSAKIRSHHSRSPRIDQQNSTTNKVSQPSDYSQTKISAGDQQTALQRRTGTNSIKNGSIGQRSYIDDQKTDEELIQLISSKGTTHVTQNELEQMKKQYHIGSATAGKLIGEVSMKYRDDPAKNRRIYSCFTESEFAIVILMNHTVFDILLKEKLKRDSEQLSHFIYTTLPGISHNYTFNKVNTHSSYIFEQHEISKGQIMLKEGGESNHIYIIKEGQVTLYKKMPSLNYTEKNLFRTHKVLDLGKGDIFGEDKLFFNCPNKYTVKVTSIKLQIVLIENSNLQHNFRRLWPDMLDNFEARNVILNNQLENIRKQFRPKGMKNFDMHVIANLPKYEEIEWQKKPLQSADNKIDKFDYVDNENDQAKAKTKKQATIGHDILSKQTVSKTAVSSSNAPTQVGPPKSMILTIINHRKEIVETQSQDQKDKRWHERINQVHEVARITNSIKFRPYNQSNYDKEEMTIMHSNIGSKDTIKSEIQSREDCYERSALSKANEKSFQNLANGISRKRLMIKQGTQEVNENSGLDSAGNQPCFSKIRCKSGNQTSMGKSMTIGTMKNSLQQYSLFNAARGTVANWNGSNFDSGVRLQPIAYQSRQHSLRTSANQMKRESIQQVRASQFINMNNQKNTGQETIKDMGEQVIFEKTADEDVYGVKSSHANQTSCCSAGQEASSTSLVQRLLRKKQRSADKHRLREKQRYQKFKSSIDFLKDKSSVNQHLKLSLMNQISTRTNMAGENQKMMLNSLDFGNTGRLSIYQSITVPGRADKMSEKKMSTCYANQGY